MNTLSNSKIYLTGPIESSDNAAEWRINLAVDLCNIEPTFKIWDPLIKPAWVDKDCCDMEVAMSYKKYIASMLNNQLQLTEDVKGKRCYDTNVKVRALCKMLANKCDILIARITDTFTWGSIHELEIAIDRHIPIFLWLPKGITSIYGLAGCVHNFRHINYYVHSSRESMLDTIREVNTGGLKLPEIDPETWLYLTWTNVAENTNAESRDRSQ